LAGAKVPSDARKVDGLLVQPVHRPTLVYLLLNKPVGVVSTCYDPQGRPTVLDLLSEELRDGKEFTPLVAWTPTLGALLLTNDGDLTFGLTHPRHSIPKTYHVWVQSYPPESVLQQWRRALS